MYITHLVLGTGGDPERVCLSSSEPPFLTTYFTTKSSKNATARLQQHCNNAPNSIPSWTDNLTHPSVSVMHVAHACSEDRAGKVGVATTRSWVAEEPPLSFSRFARGEESSLEPHHITCIPLERPASILWTNDVSGPEDKRCLLRQHAYYIITT